MSHIRLFERGERIPVEPPLMVTGVLPNAQPSMAYEGRLEIINPIGDCTVNLVSGTLPPGSTLSVDNTTKQVVVAWPAYQSGPVPIYNGDAELGTVGWEFGKGWQIGGGGPGPGIKRFEFINFGGESLLQSKTQVAVPSGTMLTASCDVEQGASSRGNAGAACRLEFRDATGAVVSHAEGNVVFDGSGGAIHPSTVPPTPMPDNAAFVNIAARGFRKRQNLSVWVDNFTWNASLSAVGVNTETTIGPITLRVRDAAGRTADWTGSIIVSAQYARWDPLKSHGATLSGDLRSALANNGATYQTVVADAGKSSGKWMAEMWADAAPANAHFYGVWADSGAAVDWANPGAGWYLGGVAAARESVGAYRAGGKFEQLSSGGAVFGADGAFSFAGTASVPIAVLLDLDASPPNVQFWKGGVIIYGRTLPAGKTWHFGCTVSSVVSVRINGGQSPFVNPVSGYLPMQP